MDLNRRQLLISGLLTGIGAVAMVGLKNFLKGSGDLAHGSNANGPDANGSDANGSDMEPWIPPVFVGHGSPMNALATNSYTEVFRQIGHNLPRPRAILCVSAHWETEGTQVVIAPQPQQIFDFYGFPKELYQIKYTPQGEPSLGQSIIHSNAAIAGSDQWGIDHGAWTVLHHMYPEASIPVVQLSLNKNYSPLQHLELGQSLAPFLGQGVLVMGSGNIVHNLRRIEMEPESPPYSWATEFEEEILLTLQNSDLSAKEKVQKITSSRLLNICHPSLEHLLPLFYILGAAQGIGAPKELIRGIQHGSISMASLQFGGA